MTEQLYRIRPIEWVESVDGKWTAYGGLLVVVRDRDRYWSLFNDGTVGSYVTEDDAKAVCMEILEDVVDAILEPVPNPAIEGKE